MLNKMNLFGSCTPRGSSASSSSFVGLPARSRTVRPAAGARRLRGAALLPVALFFGSRGFAAPLGGRVLYESQGPVAGVVPAPESQVLPYKPQAQVVRSVSAPAIPCSGPQRDDFGSGAAQTGGRARDRQRYGTWPGRPDEGEDERNGARGDETSAGASPAIASRDCWQQQPPQPGVAPDRYYHPQQTSAGMPPWVTPGTAGGSFLYFVVRPPTPTRPTTTATLVQRGAAAGAGAGAGRTQGLPQDAGDTHPHPTFRVITATDGSPYGRGSSRSSTEPATAAWECAPPVRPPPWYNAPTGHLPSAPSLPAFGAGAQPPQRPPEDGCGPSLLPPGAPEHIQLMQLQATPPSGMSMWAGDRDVGRSSAIPGRGDPLTSRTSFIAGSGSGSGRQKGSGRSATKGGLPSSELLPVLEEEEVIEDGLED